MILRRANADDATTLTHVLEAAYAPFQLLGLLLVTSSGRQKSLLYTGIELKEPNL